MTDEPLTAGHTPPLRAAAAMLLLGASVVWALWPALVEMNFRYRDDPTYSHGYLVPLFAAGLLWSRRQQVDWAALRPAWWGLALVVLGAAVQVVGTYYYVRWLIGASMIIYLAGGCALVGGRPLLQWAWPGLAFLVFMIPLPWQFEILLRGPLRRVATVASAYILRTIGLPALDEGNVIHINEHAIGIIEACSGLKMLITFFAFATAVAMVSRRPWVDRVLIVLSAVPIALIANIVRITATGILNVTVGDKVADIVFHDLAGWFMMPVGLGLLWVELQLLGRLLIEPSPLSSPSPALLAGVLTGPAVIDRPSGRQSRR